MSIRCATTLWRHIVEPTAVTSYCKGGACTAARAEEHLASVSQPAELNRWPGQQSQAPQPAPQARQPQQQQQQQPQQHYKQQNTPPPPHTHTNVQTLEEVGGAKQEPRSKRQ